jgi:hypothetical protein
VLTTNAVLTKLSPMPMVQSTDAKSGHKRLAHGVGAILVIARRKAALSRAKTSFVPAPCLGQCLNVVWFDLAGKIR